MKRFILLILTIVLIASCTSCSADDATQYIENAFQEIKEAFDNIEQSGDSETIFKSENGMFILENDATLSSEYTLKSKTLDLNNHTLILEDTLFMESGSTVQNGKIIMKGSCCTAISANGANITLDNIEMEVSASYDAIGVYTCREITIKNSKIITTTTASTANTSAFAVKGTLLGEATIIDLELFASVQYGTAMAIYMQSDTEIYNSKLIAWSNYDSDDKSYISYSIGCYCTGNLTIENAYVYGVHSGIDSSGNTYINGGTYEGYGHGGIYCSGTNSTYYIYNSIIKTAELPENYIALRTARTENGMYIGGGARRNNIVVYMDNCQISGIKHDIVLRGSSGETDNKLYISNCTLEKQSIRIDNDTHELYIGENCNVDANNTTDATAVNITNERYNKK